MRLPLRRTQRLSPRGMTFRTRNSNRERLARWRMQRSSIPAPLAKRPMRPNSQTARLKHRIRKCSNFIHRQCNLTRSSHNLISLCRAPSRRINSPLIPRRIRKVQAININTRDIGNSAQRRA